VTRRVRGEFGGVALLGRGVRGLRAPGPLGREPRVLGVELGRASGRLVAAGEGRVALGQLGRPPRVPGGPVGGRARGLGVALAQQAVRGHRGEPGEGHVRDHGTPPRPDRPGAPRLTAAAGRGDPPADFPGPYVPG